MFNPQVWNLHHSGAAFVGIKMDNEFTVKRRIWARLLKASYIYWNVVTPFQNHGLGLTPFFHVMVLGVASSITLSLLFSLSHNFVDSDRDPTKSYRETGKEVCWYKSQVETSSTYGGFIAGCLTGGLNCQM